MLYYVFSANNTQLIDLGKYVVCIIDGAIAIIMGLDRAIRYGNDTGASVYDDRGILFI